MTAPLTPTAPVVPTMPTKPVTRGVATSGSQRDRRFTDTFFDTYKHPRFPNGRPFTGEREFTSGTDRESITAGFITSDLQCGEFFCENPEMGQTPEERMRTLNSVWVAPWLPPGGKKYMTFNYRRKRIQFDYVRGEQDERRALELYYRAAAKLSGANGWGEVKFGVTPSYQVTSVLGDPSPLLPIWQAARAGDPWLMGAVDEPNEALAKILGLGDIHYLGAPMSRFGDAEYVSAPVAQRAEPLIKPETVMATPVADLAKMVAEIVAQTLDAREAAKKAADSKRMEKVRAARKPAGASV